jgi:hypothetical protein
VWSKEGAGAAVELCIPSRSLYAKRESGAGSRGRSPGVRIPDVLRHGHDTPSGDGRAASAAGWGSARARFSSKCHFQIS